MKKHIVDLYNVFKYKMYSENMALLLNAILKDAF